jgi:hypothetical protein
MRYEVGMALTVEADNEEQAALVALQVERLRDISRSSTRGWNGYMSACRRYSSTRSS